MKNKKLVEWIFCILAVAAMVLLFAGFLARVYALVYIGLALAAVVILTVALLATFTDMFLDKPDSNKH